jgi:uncharacterized protein YecA (UPF0149 family)
MTADSIEDRFRKKEDRQKLADLARRRLSTEEVEAEEAALQKAKEERARNPDKYRLHAAAGIGRNDPCPCGSGKKFKKCCGAKKA